MTAKKIHSRSSRYFLFIANYHGAVGELLRKVGPYAAQVAKWRTETDDANSATFKKKRGPKPILEVKSEKQIAELKRINAKLEERLRRAKIVIEVKKKYQRSWE